MKSVHIIGVGGVTTSALAKMFSDLGWQVSGSDEGIYPPSSDYLERHPITLKTPYAAGNLPEKVDLVVVGGNALIKTPQNPEYRKAQQRGLKIVSYPEVLAEFMVKPLSLVVAGTYGKTTITALLAWFLDFLGFNPSFMIGAQPLNFPDGIRLSQGPVSVIEGDEHPTLNFDPRPKFAFYRPTHVLLTSCLWDHINVYPTPEAFVNAFLGLARSLPSEGLLLVNADGENVRPVIKAAPCRVVTYRLKEKADYTVSDLVFAKEATRFTLQGPTLKMRMDSPLLGEHNVSNVLGSLALICEFCRELGKASMLEKLPAALARFKGVKRRLEVKSVVAGVTVFDDLAHSPVKARETLRALRTRFRGRILAVFDPHASSLHDRSSLSFYPHAFDEASEVLIPKVFSRGSSEKRVLGKEIVAAIKSTKPEVSYHPQDDELVEYVAGRVRSGDVVVFMSSGGWRGMVEALTGSIKRRVGE